ncbi:AAA family ATPase [Spirochaeta dissipatitropha]
MSNTDMSLFSNIDSHAPFPDRMRPRQLEEFIGQEHIIGEGRLLRRAIQADRISTLIFYGPPGTGKTTLARVIANTTKRAFTSLNAVLGGVAEVRKAIEQAKSMRDLYDRSTILFVDEVHRWNKAQQDALLPWVENGTVIFIGATTENPYFAVNSALVSRSRVFQLKPLGTNDLQKVAEQALRDPVRGYGKYDVTIDPDALDHLVQIADGDARSLLGAIELAVETSGSQFPPHEGETIHVTLPVAEDSIQRKAVLYDREGDYHYDTISAFIKSVRGSDPDAALYWLSRMVYSGEDPRYIFRRMLISAGEDIGLADPHALGVVNQAAQAFERVGMPEGQYFLTHAVLYLANAPKSNSSLGYFDALKTVEQEAQHEVPNHLRDDSRDKHGFGHGQGYAYPHAYRDHWVAQDYLPSGLKGKVFYQPGKLGWEGSIHQTVNRRREIQLTVHSSDDFPEILSFSPRDKGRDAWIRRIQRSGNGYLNELRDHIWSRMKFARHHTILTAGQFCTVLTGEALRNCPEGGVTALPYDSKELEFLTHKSEELPEEDRPLILEKKGCTSEILQQTLHPFDRITGVNILLESPQKEKILKEMHQQAQEGALMVLAELYPAGGSRLSQFLDNDFRKMNPSATNALTETENNIYESMDDPKTAWKPDDLTEMAAEAGWKNIRYEEIILEEKRILNKEIISRWILDTSSRFGKDLSERCTDQQLVELAEELIRTMTKSPVTWFMKFIFLSASA